MKHFSFFFLLLPIITFSQRIFIPDTSLNNVSLMTKESFEKKFMKYKLPDFYEADHPPKIEFINSDKTQKLTVFHCYGGYKNEICTFRVESRKKSDSIPFYGVKITDKGFKSGKGIQLGITLEDFKRKIGTKKFKTETKNGVTKITIELSNFKDNRFLQSYNMPVYLAEYYFKNGRLTIFEFGFPNP